MDATRLRWVAAAVAAGLLAAACSRAPSRGHVAAAPAGPRIPHDKHAEADLACTDCHAPKDWKEGQPYEPRFPTWEKCSECHEEPEIKAKFFSADGKPLWRRSFDALPQDVRFRHGRHLAVVPCASCHGDLVKHPAERKTGTLIEKATCMACHAQKGASNACEVCHLTTRANVKPESHSHLWMERHGRLAHTPSERRAMHCDLCHVQQDFCENCHLDQAPRSHTNLFRTSTHGLVAAVDRTKCQVCHTTDFCERCHEDTPPRSHRGNWMTGYSAHCGDCHFPWSSNPQCQICHQAPQHDSAPDQPDWHVPGMNCRLCHAQFGPGQNQAPPYRHYDNGMQCDYCHH